MITKNCQSCQTAFTLDDSGCDALSVRILNMKTFCSECSERMIAEDSERARAMERERREASWLSICPPLYRETRLDHPDLNPEMKAAASAWDPLNPGRMGLGFMGRTGHGKTRLLYLCLKRAFDEGLSVHSIKHLAFADAIIRKHFSRLHEDKDKADNLIARLATVDVLLLDDLGKAISSEHCDCELLELIETRYSAKLPTLWSSNGHGAWLANRLGVDRGPAIVRRLAETSVVVRAEGPAANQPNW